MLCVIINKDGKKKNIYVLTSRGKNQSYPKLTDESTKRKNATRSTNKKTSHAPCHESTTASAAYKASHSLPCFLRATETH